MQGYSFRSLTDLVLKIFKTKITAGVGLSGGGSLEADRTLTVTYGTTAGTAVQGNDTRVVNAASNATVNAKEAALETKKADKAITITAGTGLSGGGTLAANRSLAVTYGTAAGTAAQGNDSRIVNAVPNTITITAGTGLTGGGTLAANRSLAVTYGTAAGTAAQGNDSRITGALQSSQVVQVTGTSTTSVMSQKAATDQLATKAASSHTHPWSQVTGQPAQATRWPTFDEVTGKPATYTPSAHTHAGHDVRTLGNRLTVDADGAIHLNNTGYRQAGMYGFYDASRIDHIWSMGTAYRIPANGANFGTLYGLAYKHTNNATGGTMAGGHQAVWCANGVPKVALGDNIWAAGTVIAGNVTIGGKQVYHTGNMPATATRWPTWAEVTSKPTTFAPSAHTHAWAQVTGQPATATRWPTWAEVSGKPTINIPIGVSQTWQAPSRAFGTTYTNSTGRPIQILVNYYDSGSSSGATFKIDSLSRTTSDVKGGSGYAYWFSAVIPNGSTYSISGGATLAVWWELR